MVTNSYPNNDSKATLSFIDTKRYPVHEPQSQKFAQITARAREELQNTGACVLEGFLTPAALQRAVHEAERLKDISFHSTVTGNAYLSQLREDLPADHPMNLTETTALAVVASDQIPADTVISQVYEAPSTIKFVEAIVNRGPLYKYACPMGALNIAVMKDGDYLRWHFDQSNFVVSIPLQDPETGGKFEFVRRIRSAKDECYDQVAALLNGDRTNVETMTVAPGSLVLFEGRYTIHRVTEIKGKRLRLGALLSYVTEPGQTSSNYLRMIRYGRTS